MTVVLSEEDRKELVELYRRAQTTPMIRFSVAEPFLSTLAWNQVREKMKELGEKYGYDPTSSIDPETGEIQSSTPKVNTK